MQQNTKEWLEWRRKGLGASDASVVLGISPYRTRFQLWENKLGLRPDDPESFITEMGHKFEPRARAQFALLTGLDLKDNVCIEHPDVPWLRASLDGHEEKERVFAEIKMIGKEKMAQLRAGEIPDEHYPQVMQQFMVTKYERGFYIGYTLDKKYSEITDFHYVQLAPNREYMEKLFVELQKFWTLVQSQTPPELEARDEYEFKDENSFMLATLYVRLSEQMKKIGTAMDETAEKLKALAASHSRARINNLSISKVVRKGTVQYKDVPQLKGVDLEPYRGKPSTFQTISVDKPRKESQ